MRLTKTAKKAEPEGPQEDAAEGAVRLDDLFGHSSGVRLVRGDDDAQEDQDEPGEGGGSTQDREHYVLLHDHGPSQSLASSGVAK